MSAAKKWRTTRVELEKLLEEFYENVENETFLGNAFTGEKEDLGEPDSSLDEDNDKESIANEEEIETNLQEADFETPETKDVNEEEERRKSSTETKIQKFGWSSQWEELWWATTAKKVSDHSGDKG